MITAIHIENFKGIRERTTIEIRPLTLLFGANSAGKSTLLHALQLARELFCRQRTDVESLDGLDLGGFENYVNDRDPDKTLTLRFDLDLGGTNFLTEWPIDEHFESIPGRDADEQDDYSTMGDEIRTGYVEVMLQANGTGGAKVAGWTVGYEGEPLARVWGEAITHFNAFHPLVLWPEPKDGEFSKLGRLNVAILPIYAIDYAYGEPVTASELGDNEKRRLTRTNFDEGEHEWILRECESRGLAYGDKHMEANAIIALRSDGRCLKDWGFHGWAEDGTQSTFDRCVHAWLEKWDQVRKEETPAERFVRPGFDDDVMWASIYDYAVKIRNTTATGLPNSERGLDLEISEDWFDDRGEPDPELREIQHQRTRTLKALLNRFLIVPMRVLKNSLDEIRFVGPIRDGIPRNYAATRTVANDLWYSGLAAWDLLHRNPNELVKHVSQWLEDRDRLNTGYELRHVAFRELPAMNPISATLTTKTLTDTDQDELRKWIERLPLRTRVDLVHAESALPLHPADVGQGITQMVPVVTAAVAPSGSNGTLVTIEQPELHLNPRQQAALGDVFIASALMSPKHRFILETHSEHLILRIQRRIREATNRRNQLLGAPPKEGPLPLEREKSDNPLALDIRDIDVGVYHVKQDGGSTNFQLWPLLLDGDFQMPWPDDFFEVDFRERFAQ